MVGKKPQKCSVKQVLAAIKDSGGIKTSIAQKLRISRFTVDNYEKKYPTIEKAIVEERDKIRDKAESNIFGKIQNGDIGVSQWYLRYKGGYVEQIAANITEEVKITERRNITLNISDATAKKIADLIAREKLLPKGTVTVIE